MIKSKMIANIVQFHYLSQCFFCVALRYCFIIHILSGPSCSCCGIMCILIGRRCTFCFIVGCKGSLHACL
ncbi:hypothetical protein BRADI_1g27503v3 [Brachypodium distachyon]|uniref:Uncharacterized protein n=1 Tax=Brachypodium distachyon TaxID=15368 RepID=A0A2K2DLF6_BRADI|nr:hypothetical protein BRADI_1g27503v3 [Brachypodium distachyon]